MESDFFDDEYFSKPTPNPELAQKLREKYMKRPPEGYTSDEISQMRDNDILDMDYFMNEF